MAYPSLFLYFFFPPVGFFMQLLDRGHHPYISSGFGEKTFLLPLYRVINTVCTYGKRHLFDMGCSPRPLRSWLSCTRREVVDIIEEKNCYNSYVLQLLIECASLRPQSIIYKNTHCMHWALLCFHCLWVAIGVTLPRVTAMVPSRIRNFISTD